MVEIGLAGVGSIVAVLAVLAVPAAGEGNVVGTDLSYMSLAR